jgi:hypothetical protein
MSRHIPRSARWTRLGPNEHVSAEGVVRFERGAWWAILRYQLCDPAAPGDALLVWHESSRQLGPFKRPRNAMMAAESQAELLRRRHGECIRFEAAAR